MSFSFCQRFQLVVLLIGLFSLNGWADQSSAQRVDSIDSLIAQGNEAYGNQQFELAFGKFNQAIQEGSKDPSVAFNAGCCASLLGNTESAFQLLGQSIALGWADLRHMNRDDDLKPLHKDERWKELLDQVKANARFAKNRWSSKQFVSSYKEDLSAAEKAAGLSKLWAEVKFNFVNFHLVPELDWDHEYMTTMPKVLATDTTLEYYRLLEELVAKLKDGHTNVYLPNQLQKHNARPSIRTMLVENKIVLVKVLDPKLEKDGIVPGMEVSKIEGIPAIEFAKQNIEKYVAGSTVQDRNQQTYGKSLLRGLGGTEVEIELVDFEGTRKTHRLIRKATGNRLMSYFGRKAPAEISILEGNIAHVKLNSFATNQASRLFADSFDEIKDCDGLILDLRENGGGNSGVGWKILSFLTDKPFPTTQWHMLQYRPTHRAWNRPVLAKFGKRGQTYAADAEFHFKKPVAMLVGPNTFSAAEDMAAAFDMLDRGKIIGQATGGSTGQPIMFPLPGGGTARVCTKHDFYADGTEFVGVGIQPDISVEPTVEDIRTGFDRTLSTALELLRSQ